MHILVTGAAGFIGYHLADALLARGHRVLGIDDLNSYYDPMLKRARLARLERRPDFRFARADIAAPGELAEATGRECFDIVMHLAAQAGVRHALENPGSYTRSNLVGHHNMLEFARRHEGLSHFVYASSSSVYGNDTKAPFREDARADHPVSYYGATKRAGELMAYSYAELFGLRLTGLRLFTVYGPWGRPDMAYWLFTDAILNDRPVPIFGHGRLARDFTYIDDVVATVVRIVETPFQSETAAPHRLYNLGNSHPETVLELVAAIEAATGKRARLVEGESPPGDVRETYADISRAVRDFGFAPEVQLRDGITRFVAWFKAHHASNM